MADAASMLERCLRAQQGHAPCLVEAQARGSEDMSWKVDNAILSKTDHGVEGVHDLPPEENQFGGCG